MALIFQDQSGLAEGLGQFTSALSRAVADASRQRQMEQAQIAKNKESLPFSLARYTKAYEPAIAEVPQRQQLALQLAERYVDQGDPISVAIQKASQEVMSQPSQIEDSSANLPSHLARLQGQKTQEPYQSVFDPALGKEVPQLSISDILQELPVAGLKLGEFFANPLIQLAQQKSVPVDPNLSYQEYKQRKEEGSLPEREKYFNRVPSEIAAEKLRENLPENVRQEREKVAEGEAALLGLVQPSQILKGINRSGFRKLFNGLFESQAAKAGTSAEKVADQAFKKAESVGVNLEAVASGDRKETQRLWNVLRQEQKTPTVRAAERASKKGISFSPETEIAIREAQLASQPKYAEEIAKDAAEMAERRAAKVPKTAVGEASQSRRIAMAQENLSKTEDLYRNVNSRLRSLEDALPLASAKDRPRIEALLRYTRQEAADTERLVERAYSNLKGDSVRQGPAQHREAAQKKLSNLSEDVMEGKEIILSKRDYNPKIIQEAKKLSKKSRIPSRERTDFYNQVHDEYESVYRQRLRQLDDKIEQVQQKASTLSERVDLSHLKKERDIVQKLIDQTQAEKVIHSRKLDLRDIGARKAAQDRFKQLSPEKAVPRPELQEVSRESIEASSRYFENPNAETLKEAVRSSGIPETEFKKASSILKESESFGTGPNPVKQAKEFLDKARKVYKELNKTQSGRFIRRILFRHLGLPANIGAAGLSYWVYNKARKQYRIKKYRDALKRGDSNALANMRREYGPTVAREARQGLL